MTTPQAKCQYACIFLKGVSLPLDPKTHEASIHGNYPFESTCQKKSNKLYQRPKNLFLNVCQRSSSWSWIVCGAFVEKVFFSCLEALSAPTSFFEDGQQRSIVKAWKLETCLTTTTAQTRPRSDYDFVSATRQLAEGWKTRSVQQATEQQNKTFALDASFVRFA